MTFQPGMTADDRARLARDHDAAVDAHGVVDTCLERHSGLSGVDVYRLRQPCVHGGASRHFDHDGFAGRLRLVYLRLEAETGCGDEQTEECRNALHDTFFS